MGSILARWVACEVSLAALVEVMAYTSFFMHHCDQYLINLFVHFLVKDSDCFYEDGNFDVYRRYTKLIGNEREI